MKQQARISEQDAYLIQRITTGDERALSELAHLYAENIFRYALRLTQNATIAEEVTNDVLLEVWSAAAGFRAASKLTTWLLGITRFKALNAVRGKRLHWVEDRVLAEVPDNMYDIERDIQAVEHQRRVRVIRAALLQLSVEHREVLDLTFFHDCSYQQIADIVDVPVATVRTRMHYAKGKLRQALQAVDANLFRDLLG